MLTIQFRYRKGTVYWFNINTQCLQYSLDIEKVLFIGLT